MVTIAGRNEARLREAASALAGELGCAVHWAPCDVTDEAAVERAVAVAAEPLGGLHVAVANAGGGAGGPILSTSLDMWRYVMDVNVTGTFLTVKHAGQAMVRSGGGAIVAISSIAAVLTHRLMAPYCTSKAAIEMLVRCVADELGPLGVRANAVGPGLVPPSWRRRSPTIGQWSTTTSIRCRCAGSACRRTWRPRSATWSVRSRRG